LFAVQARAVQSSTHRAARADTARPTRALVLAGAGRRPQLELPGPKDTIVSPLRPRTRLSTATNRPLSKREDVPIAPPRAARFQPSTARLQPPPPPVRPVLRMPQQPSSRPSQHTPITPSTGHSSGLAFTGRQVGTVARLRTESTRARISSGPTVQPTPCSESPSRRRAILKPGP
jgi:hypothetical protein